MSRSRLLTIVLLLAVSTLLLGAGDPADKRFNDLGHKLMCKCGCNQVLLECNHVGCEYSDRMRRELMAGIQRGDSDDLVLQAFVQKYGMTVLAAPPQSGFNVVAWIAPFAALGFGIWLLVFVVRKWKFQLAPVGKSNLPPAEREIFRQRAREETEL